MFVCGDEIPVFVAECQKSKALQRLDRSIQIRSGAGRGGLTLIEVLMAILVVTLGLVGIATLLPLSAHDTRQGSINDAAALVAKRAWRNFTVMGLNQPDKWFYNTGQPVFGQDLGNPVRDPITILPGYPPIFPTTLTWRAIDGTPLPVPPPLVLDPILFNASMFPENGFPPTSSPGIARCFPSRLQLTPQMGNQITVALREADRVAAADTFRSEDDLVFEIPDRASEQPRQLFSSISRRRQSNGYFSWLVMLDPVSTDGSFYKASIVLFHQRITSTTGERVLPATALRLGISLGGVDVKFASDELTDLEISNGDWVLLVKLNSPYMQWYQVSRTIGEPEKDPLVQQNYSLTAKLNGPDTRIHEIFDGDPNSVVYGVILENVQTVYEKTIGLDFTGS